MDGGREAYSFFPRLSGKVRLIPGVRLMPAQLTGGVSHLDQVINGGTGRIVALKSCKPLYCLVGSDCNPTYS
jgi:hypothetical protein